MAQLVQPPLSPTKNLHRIPLTLTGEVVDDDHDRTGHLRRRRSQVLAEQVDDASLATTRAMELLPGGAITSQLLTLGETTSEAPQP